MKMNDDYLVLSRKWRPQSFDDVVGQKHVTQTLQNALNQNRLGHGYLFTGSRGVGKTSVARILSRVVNCSNPENSNPCNKCNICIDILKGSNFDVIELDGASNRGIDEIRDLRESVKYSPTSGKYKVYIIDEVHMLTKEAFNALLKTLEEPPKHVLFVLATTDPHKIPQTILSRTQRFNFKRISIEQINEYLSKILNHENKEFDNICLKLISKKADGSMRDALSLLDQVIAYCDDSIDVENVSQAIGLIDNSVYSKILFFTLKSDLSNILKTVNDSLYSGHSINDFTDGFIGFLNNCMHFQLNDNIDEDVFFDDEIKIFLKKIESDLDMDFIIMILDSMLQFQNKLKFVNQPMISLESQFIKLAYLKKGIEVSIDNDILKYVEKKKVNVESESINLNEKKEIDLDGNAEETIAEENKNSANNKRKDNEISNRSIPDRNPVLNEDKNGPIKSSLDDSAEEIIAGENKNPVDNKNRSNKESDHSGAVPDSNSALNEDKNGSIKIEDIQEKWSKIIRVIDEKNPKTSSFLSEALIHSFEASNITLSILNGSQFHINSLENDVNIINDSFSKVLGERVSVHFQIKVDENVKQDKEDKPKQHPLLDKAIDLLDGEIIDNK